MFKNAEIIDSSKHKHLRFTPETNYSYAASTSAAPLSATEIIEAGKFFPVSFTTEGDLLPIAMLSLKKSQNAFIDNMGQWLAPYVPAHIRRYPFILGASNKPDQFALMADMDAPQFKTQNGDPLYNSDGSNAPVLDKAIQFLKTFQQDLATTEKLLQPLASTGVLAIKSINIPNSKGEKTVIERVRVVDQERLMALGDATLAAWVRSGLMGVIYATAGSMNNLTLLVNLHEIRTQESTTQAREPF